MDKHCWQCLVGLRETVWAGASHREDCWLCSLSKTVGAGSEVAVCSESCHLSSSTHGPGCCGSGPGQSTEQGMLSRLIAGGQGGENEGWSNIVAGRQTNAEQMFNYQHSVLVSLKISASKCRYFMATYASAGAGAVTVPTFPWTVHHQGWHCLPLLWMGHL